MFNIAFSILTLSFHFRFWWLQLAWLAVAAAKSALSFHFRFWWLPLACGPGCQAKRMAIAAAKTSPGTLCPSGLRGWTQVPLAQAARVQIPQVSFFMWSNIKVQASRLTASSRNACLHILEQKNHLAQEIFK